MKELEDYSWFPSVLRNFQTAFIGFVVARFRIYDGFIHHLQSLKSPVVPMFDLCSGSGEPAKSIFKKSACFSHLSLSDKYPDQNISNKDNPYPIETKDVLDMEFEKGTCYTMFNAFHHFSDTEKIKIVNKIKPKSYQQVYFSYYEYGYPYSFYQSNQRISLDKELDVILLSAIANTDYLYNYLDKEVKTIHEIEYADHHVFDKHDIEKIIKVYNNNESKRKLIITTEKDAMRLEMHKEQFQKNNIPIFILSAKVAFHFEEGEKFQAEVKKYLLDFRV